MAKIGILIKLISYKNKLFAIIKRDKLFSLMIVLIVALAVFFRTYNYTDRIFIQADNSRDIQVARYAADNLKIPQIGQFSSAGPFFYGPWYYWFLEIINFLPLGLLTHWYFMTFIYLVFIWVIYWLGNKIGGRFVAATAALFAAISPAQIRSSFNVWNPAIIPFLVALSLVLLLKFYETKKKLFIFLLGFVVSLATTIHLQFFLVWPIMFVAFFSIKPSFKDAIINLSFLLLGIVIPLLPLIYFDWRHNWYNVSSLFIFLAVDQYSIWVPNRWLIYIFDYWPGAWGYIIGGNKLLGGLIISLLSIFTMIKFKSFTKFKIFYLVAIVFILEVFLYRYYRGERHLYYSLFAHPFVLILTAWAAVQLFRFNKFLGVILVSTILVFTTNRAIVDLDDRGITLREINEVKEEIYRSFPQDNFDIFGCGNNPSATSHPLALVMYVDGRNNVDGRKIGICEYNDAIPWKELTDENFHEILWINKSTSTVYTDTVEWWKEKSPQKGNLWKFIKEKVLQPCYPHC